jgi:hypothetical protein
MKSVLDKQTAHLQSIQNTIKQDRMVQLTQVVLQAKTDKDIIQESEESNDHLKGIKEHSKKTSDQIAALLKTIKEQTNLLKKKDLSDVSTKALSMEVTKGPKNIKELMFGSKQENKDFKTVRGFLDQTGFVSKGSGSRMDTFLGNREARNTHIDDRMKRNPNMVNLKQYGGDERKLKKSLGEQYDKNNDTITAIQENDKQFKRLESAGFDPSDRRNSALFKPLTEEKEKLSAKLEKDDVRFRQAKQETAVKETVKEKKVKAEETASEFSDESSLENERRQEELVRLLALIEENTRNEKGAIGEKPTEASGGNSMLDGIMSMMGAGIMKAFKFLLNPRFLLKALTKVFVPAMIIGSMVNGIVDAFKAFFNGGSFSDVIIAGLGGVLKVLTFGLFDAQTVKKIVSVISGFVTDYIIEPIKNFMGFVGKAFDTYIKEPIMGAFELIGNLFTEYIINPIKEFFAPISSFFSNIKNQVFGFLEDFGIPEVGFTIPIINKKVSIGPFYPFRPGEGVNRVASNKSLDQSSSSNGDETSKFNQNVVTSGKTEYSKEYIAKATPEERERIKRESADKTNVLSIGETFKDGKAGITQNLATFDPRTGKASLYGDASGLDDNHPTGEREISKRAFSKIKANAKSGGSADNVAEIVKEDDAYQKLGFLDRRKVDLGMAKATELTAVPEKNMPTTGTAVYNQSAQNSEAAAKSSNTSQPIIVSAPTTNNTTKQSIAMPAPVRNEDSGFNKYINRSAFAF